MTRRIDAAATFAVALALTLAWYGPYFDPSKDVSRIAVAPGERHTDLTPQFGPASILWGEALARGGVAHWNPYILSGTPNLANPQSRFVGVENALNLLLRGQLSARWSVPIQIWIGWLGIFLFVRALKLPAPAAIVAGTVYLFDPSWVGFHVATGHLNIVNGVTFVPWLAYLTIRPFRRALLRPVLVGATLALMIHGGAATIALYACGALFPTYAVARGRRDGWADALRDLAVVAAVALGLSWIKIAPAIDFMRVSDRQHGMSTALAFVSEAPFADAGAPYLPAAIVALAVVGAAALYRTDRRVFAVAAAGTALVAAYVAFEPAFALAREGLPLLGALRVPSRSLFLVLFEVALLAAVGVTTTASRLGAPERAAQWAVGLALAGCAWAFAPAPPTMVDLAARREANPILRYVRRDPSFFRLTSFQDRDRNWGYQHQTVPYGIRTFLGYEATWAQDFLYSEYTESVGKPQYPFVPTVFRNYATMVGLLSVKYVSSLVPLDEPGLRLVREFPISYGPQPPKSRGPFLYENERSMPRAYHGTLVVAVPGPEPETKRATLELLADRRFSPDRFTLVAAPDGRDASAIASTEADLRLATGAPDASPGTRTAEELLASAGPSRVEALSVEEPRPEEIRVALPDARSGTWIVLSEKLAMFRGWTARVEGGERSLELPLFRANHVDTAVFVPPGAAGTLVLRYRSPGFTSGLVAMAVTLVAIAAVAVAPTRGPATG